MPKRNKLTTYRTYEEVQQLVDGIVRCRQQGMDNQQIADKYGVSKTTVGRICSQLYKYDVIKPKRASGYFHHAERYIDEKFGKKTNKKKTK